MNVIRSTVPIEISLNIMMNCYYMSIIFNRPYDSRWPATQSSFYFFLGHSKFKSFHP